MLTSFTQVKQLEYEAEQVWTWESVKRKKEK